MVGRVILLIAAFVVAALGALLVFLYAQQADERAARGYKSVDVLVVEQDVPAGTSMAAALEAGSFVQLTRPRIAVPDGFLADTSQTEGFVVLSNLYRGEVLLQQKVGNPADLEALPIPDGQIAASFTFGDPNRVADFIAPGSDVAVFLTRTPAQVEATDPDTGETTVTAGTQTTRLLLPEVKIIAIGGTTTQTVTTTNAAGEQQTTETNLSLLTLSLTQRQAEQVILAQSSGELYLGLLTETSVIEPGTGTTAENLFEAAP